MWCDKCHFGVASLTAPVGRKCPQCGIGSISLHKNPFDKKPTKKYRSEEEDFDNAPKVEKIVKTTKETKDA